MGKGCRRGGVGGYGGADAAPIWEREMHETLKGRTAGGVIPWPKRQEAARFAALDDVRRYWDALRGERLVPRRSEIDPRGIEGALDAAFILERIAPGIARFRLAGSALVDLMGAEVRGMPLSVLFAHESRRELGEAVEGLFSGPETVRLSLTGERGLARPTLAAQIILLPLKSDLGDVTRALGCLSLDGPIGRVPRRLVLRDAERTDLLSTRLVVPPAGALAPVAVAAAPADPQAMPSPRPEGARLRPVEGAPHLRVVEPAD